jgi:hypothetical protein
MAQVRRIARRMVKELSKTLMVTIITKKMNEFIDYDKELNSLTALSSKSGQSQKLSLPAIFCTFRN